MCDKGTLNVTYGQDGDVIAVLIYFSNGTVDQVFKLDNQNKFSYFRAECSANGCDRGLDACHFTLLLEICPA